MPRNNVLIVSNPDDVHIHKVVRDIIGFDAIPILFYPENLGQANHLSIDFNYGNIVKNASIVINQESFNLDEIYSIWYRRPRLASLNEYALSLEGLDFARDEWRSALEGIYTLVQESLWVSHPNKLKIAAIKPLQLSIAQQLGFSVPRTLITSNPNRAQEFYKYCEGKVIVKASGSGWVYTQDEADVAYVMTNRLTSENLASIEDVRIAPVTFQEEISKAYEIRVNVVGQEVLSIKIDSQKSKVSQVDWRRYDIDNTPYTPYKLPETITKQCLQLTEKLGLEFGAIDLIRRPHGEYVFLEINGNGQFLWAEQLSGVSISAAIARLLSGVTPPLKSSILD